MSLQPVPALAYRIVSQTDSHYRNGPLSETLEGIPHSAPRAGDRLPWLRLKFQANGTVEDSFQKLDDMHFNLVVIGQPPPPEGRQSRCAHRPPREGAIGLGDRLRIHVIPADPVNDMELARAQIVQPSFYLLRPDGHVGLCGVHLEVAAITRYVSEHYVP